MKQEHMYAQALRWIADGEVIEYSYRASPDVWTLLEARPTAPCAVIIFGGGGYSFRIKKKTVKIGEREVEAPLGKSESHAGFYYFVDPINETVGSSQHRREAFSAPVFSTEEAALAFHRAILNLTKN